MGRKPATQSLGEPGVLLMGAKGLSGAQKASGPHKAQETLAWALLASGLGGKEESGWKQYCCLLG